MFQANTFLSVLFIVFAFCAVIQLFYYLWFYLAPVLYKPADNKAKGEPVSVIICARNESENLKKFLPAVLEQDYPDYEVIVVNDCSEDNTYDILGGFLKKYPHLRVSNVNKDPQYTHNKKFAQFIGIKAARNEILLFTDADCCPDSSRWIEGMVSNFSDKTDFILGYGGYMKKDGILNRFIRTESMMIAIQYLGMAIRGIPYMGVGRNLAYRRSFFFNKKGFGSHTHVISGDDDLFVNSNSGKMNTRVEFRKEFHTRSLPAGTFNEWFLQKKRHMTTANYYKPRDKFILLLEPSARIIFYAAFVILLSCLFLWPVVLALFGLRLIIQILVLIMAQKKLNETGLPAFSLIFDIFSPAIYGAVLVSNTIRRPGKNQWK